MSHYLLLCRSLTYAQRTAKILERNGISAIITKAPQGLSDKGCIYCVKISRRHIDTAMGAINASGLAVGKVFFIDENGEQTEVPV